ncbi:hypothetical protein UFOVP600_2 [uncultured Caudovirales phage]|uniref:Uncharacterized protein n=1 Tax=uncultured Caudovirales phage TaxID=2100421 RepID=A0A6J5MXR7_9CAUD|nr:hypothetical protein UFOVP600_2 [uncultured Caudovirales phage]
MEQFNVEIHRIVDNKNATFYYELSPINIELKDILLHGHDDIIVGTIEETLASEIAEHKIEMFNVLQTYYPTIAVNYYL